MKPNTYHNQANHSNLHWLLALSLSLMLITQTAHADFRKALTAYQARDGATMLKEVKDAVDTKNDDGLILFLSCLERDSGIVNSSLYYLPEDKGRITYLQSFESTGKALENKAPWQNILPHSGVNEMLALLEQASKESTLESQYRLLNLRYINSYYNLIFPNGNSEQKQQFQISFNKLSSFANQGYLPLYPYLIDSLTRNNKLKQDPKLLALRKKAVAMGETRELLKHAVDVLTGDMESGVKKNEKQGLTMLATALAKPDADLYYGGEIANKISIYYLKKGTNDAYIQAYLWSILALNNETGEKFPSSLSSLRQTSYFSKVASPEIASIWDKSESFPYHLVNNVPLPYLILENHKIDLKQQPVISLYRTYEPILNDRTEVPVRNFSLDIYADGRVNFAQGTRLNRMQNKETLMRVSVEKVNTMLANIEATGFNKEPYINYSKNLLTNCGYACGEIYRGLNGLTMHYLITIRNSKQSKTVIYKNLDLDNLQPVLAKVFTMLEKSISTQQYRCGEMKERAYYQYCIDHDNKIFAIANQGENK